MAKKKVKASSSKKRTRAVQKAATKKPTRKKIVRKKAAKRATKKAVKKTAKKTAKHAVRKPAAKKPVKKALVKPALKPKRPRRTKQALPPAPRPIAVPPPVVEAPSPPPPPVLPPPPPILPPEPAAGFGDIVDVAEVESAPDDENPAEPIRVPAPLLDVGDTAPEFELPDETGRLQRLSQYRGQKVVVYFYPKDDTPGCTTEACGFRDRLGAFTDRNAVVLGLSADTVASHQRFSQKFGLPFALLADVDHAVADEWGVWVQKNRLGVLSWGIARTTFVVDAAGRIAHVFRDVQPEGHEQEVLKNLSM